MFLTFEGVVKWSNLNGYLVMPVAPMISVNCLM